MIAVTDDTHIFVGIAISSDASPANLRSPPHISQLPLSVTQTEDDVAEQSPDGPMDFSTSGRSTQSTPAGDPVLRKGQ